MDYFTFRGCEGNLVQARIFCFTLSCTGNFFVSISVYAFLSVTCFFWLNVREFFSAVVVCISCVWYKYSCSIQSNLGLRPPLLNDLHLPLSSPCLVTHGAFSTTSFPKYQKFPSQITIFGTSCKRPRPLTELKVGNFLLF